MESSITSRGYFTSQHRRGLIARGMVLVIACAASVTFLFPFFWTVSGSLKSPAEISVYPPIWIPHPAQWPNYIFVLQRTLFLTWLLNTSYVTVLSLIGSVGSACVVAYSFARFEYRGRDALFLITLGTMMLPAQVTLIPRYLLFQKLGWLNSFKPLWIPAWFGGGAFNIFLIRQFILSLPRDLDEAAVIDGAGYFTIFWSILAPLCKPVLATVAVIRFIASWNDYMDPLLFLDSREKMTLAVGIDTMRQDPASMSEHSGAPTFHYLMALCVMAIIPCVVLFFFAQRYFVRGIVLSGIKG